MGPTRFLGGDIDWRAGRAGARAVVRLHRHKIGSAALQAGDVGRRLRDSEPLRVALRLPLLPAQHLRGREDETKRRH